MRHVTFTDEQAEKSVHTFPSQHVYLKHNVRYAKPSTGGEKYAYLSRTAHIPKHQNIKPYTRKPKP